MFPGPAGNFSSIHDSDNDTNQQIFFQEVRQACNLAMAVTLAPKEKLRKAKNVILLVDHKISER